MLLLPAGFAAQNNARLNVLCEVSMDTIVERVPFNIKLTIDHPHPDEVHIEPPDFSGMLSIETTLITSAYAPDPASLLAQSAFTDEMRSEVEELTGEVLPPPEADYKYVTVVTYTVLPLKSGTLTLGQFTVSAAEKTGATWPLRLVIQNNTGDLIPSFDWQGPARITTGGESFFALALLNREALQNAAHAPDAAFSFDVESTPNAIIEKLPAGVRIIPFSTGLLTLRGRGYYNGKSFILPEKKITIAEEAAKPAVLPEPLRVPPLAWSNEAGANTAAFPAPVDWDGFTRRSIAAHIRSYRDFITQARVFWEQGRYAATLAAFRKWERETLYAPALRPLRAALEASLGFPVTKGETWLPPLVFSVCAVFFCVFLLVSFHFLRKKNEAFAFPRHVFLPVIIVVSLAAAALCAKPLSAFVPKNGAVTHDTPLFLLPERADDVDALPRFREGQHIIIHARTGRFVYAHSDGIRSGWVPAENIILY